MSLVQGYSSDEDDGPRVPTNDAFGLSALHASKKPRVDEPSTSLVPTSAPDVLAEVSGMFDIFTLAVFQRTRPRTHYTKLRW